MPKKLPNGISNYEELVRGGYYYVDKTKYIEKMEELPDKRIMFLRPRKFGKTLFTSVLENYYDVLKEEKFEELFGETYIGKNPTENKNSYHILKFNFSGIDTDNVESTMKGFKNSIIVSIKDFCLKYKLNFYINEEQSAEDISNDFYTAFKYQKENEKIYVIIDEYDHFANELLGFHTENFKNLVSKNGKVRKWYEVLKRGTESVVGRIFITGVAPITLDSLTSGFNISKDITIDERFNEMIGFNTKELIEMMDYEEISKEEQEKLLPIMKENYDGYKFFVNANEKMYNANMTLNFLSDYVGLGRMPESLVDVNIASDYSKLSKMLELCNSEEKKIIIENTIGGKGVLAEIVEKFNPEMEFGNKELISMLFYLGYLTLEGKDFEEYIFKIPNRVMKELYSEYFLKSLEKDYNISVDRIYTGISKEIALEGKIEKIINLLGEYLTNLSNRDYQKFDEKYVKLLYYCIVMNYHDYVIVSENEINREYTDLLIYPRDFSINYYSILIEFKYLKREEKSKLDEKRLEAKDQVIEYSKNLTHIKNLKKYTVVAIVDELYVDEID